MVICAVVGCDSDSTKGKKVSLFRLPKDEKLKKIWITKLKRTNLPTEKNIRDVIYTLRNPALKEI